MRVTAVEVAIGIAILGTLTAISVPACVREMHASKFAEPVQGLGRIGTAAAAADAFPESAPLTPANVPRGKMEVDPPGAWDHPTWKALAFRPTPDGVPHAFSFQIDSKPDDLVARAHGDLDGDGAMSTFEIHVARDSSGAHVAPGMYVEAEVE
jgi:hypothetical protein